MRYVYLLLLFFIATAAVMQAGSTICSWNLKNFGKSKSAGAIALIAGAVTEFDVIAIQQVVAGYGGAQAVARLQEALNCIKKMGDKPALTGQKTSLLRQCLYDDCQASEFDNIFYNTQSITATQSGVVHCCQSFPNLEDANKISDHIPIFLRFNIH